MIFSHSIGVTVFTACLTSDAAKDFREDETFKGVPFQMDITKKEDIETCVLLIKNHVKDEGLHILYNNAGTIINR